MERPKIGDRLVLQSQGSNGASSTTWFDGEVIEIADSLHDNLEFAIKVRYKEFREITSRFLKIRKRIPIEVCGWYASHQIMAIIRDDKEELEELENIYRL